MCIDLDDPDDAEDLEAAGLLLACRLLRELDRVGEAVDDEHPWRDQACADPLHLAAAFNLSPSTAVAYAGIARGCSTGGLEAASETTAPPSPSLDAHCARWP